MLQGTACLLDCLAGPKAEGLLQLAAECKRAAFFIQYGTGAVLGDVIYETITLGQPPLRVHSQGVGLAQETTAAFYAASCDGLLVRSRMHI